MTSSMHSRQNALASSDSRRGRGGILAANAEGVQAGRFDLVGAAAQFVQVIGKLDVAAGQAIGLARRERHATFGYQLRWNVPLLVDLSVVGRPFLAFGRFETLP